MASCDESFRAMTSSSPSETEVAASNNKEAAIDRLCWVDVKIQDPSKDDNDNDNDDEKKPCAVCKWPAIYYNSWHEFIKGNKDDMDSKTKAQVMMALMHHEYDYQENSKKSSPQSNTAAFSPIAYCKLLGRPLWEFVTIQKDFQYYDWMDLMGEAALHQTQPEYFARNLDQYLEFTKALDIACGIALSVEATLYKKGATWYEKGVKRLAEFQQKQQETPMQQKDGPQEVSQVALVTMATQQQKDDLQEECHVQVNDHDHFEEKKEDMPPVTPKHSNRSLRLHQKEFSSPVSTSKHSSDATVVTECTENSHTDQVTSPGPEIEPTDSFEVAVNKLQLLSQWTIKNCPKNGTTLYCAPSIEVSTGIRSARSFYKEELEEFLVRNYQWKAPPSVDMSASNVDQEDQEAKPASSSNPKKTQKRQASANVSPPNAKKTKGTPKQETERRAPPTRSSRRGPSSQKTAPSSVKKETDDFYTFNNLINILQEKEGWKYKFGSLGGYVYQRTEKGEWNGKHLDDFFREEHEVIDYCKKHNYKAKYLAFENKKAAAASPIQESPKSGRSSPRSGKNTQNIKQPPSPKMPPMWVTPPATQRAGR